MVASSSLLTNVRSFGNAATNLLVRDGHIVAMGPDVEAEDAYCIDGGGAIVVPGLVDAHMHLDKTLVGMPWYRNEVGNRLADRIEAGRQAKKMLGIDAARQSARQAMKSLAYGTTHIRTHVDVDDVGRLEAIEGVMATRDCLRGLMDIEIVAFPQSGMLVRPGTQQLMEEALKLGADVMGGIDPSSIERDPRAHLDTIFGLADRYGVPLDLHLHEPAELGAFAIELLLERTKALGMQGKVTISHAFCLGTVGASQLNDLITGLAEASVHIMSSGIASYPSAPVKRLVDEGVIVCAGTDGVRDTFGPYGNGDMLERAMLVGLRNNFYRDEDLELALDICTHGGAKTLALKGYGIVPGCRADFVLVEAETVAQAVVSRPLNRRVFRGGQMVARDGEVLVEGDLS